MFPNLQRYAREIPTARPLTKYVRIGVFWCVLLATLPGLFRVGASVCAYLRARCQDTRAAPCKGPLNAGTSQARRTWLQFAVAPQATFGLFSFSE